MGRKKNVTLPKRFRQFEAARKMVNREGREFFLHAAGAHNPPIPFDQAITDYGKLEICISTEGKCSFPPYVHKLIDSTLGLKPREQVIKQTRKRRKPRYRSANKASLGNAAYS